MLASYVITKKMISALTIGDMKDLSDRDMYGLIGKKSKSRSLTLNWQENTQKHLVLLYSHKRDAWGELKEDETQ